MLSSSPVGLGLETKLLPGLSQAIVLLGLHSYILVYSLEVFYILKNMNAF